jgi:hypothetical protein
MAPGMSHDSATSPLLAPLDPSLAQALARAPVLLAIGLPDDLVAAHVARSAFVQHAEVDILPMPPQEVRQLGPNLLRLVGLCLIMDPTSHAAWAHEMVEHVQKYRCPALLIAPTADFESQARWRITLPKPAAGLMARTDGFAALGGLCLLLAARTCALRCSPYGPISQALGMDEQALTQALYTQHNQHSAITHASGTLGSACQAVFYGEGPMAAAVQVALQLWSHGVRRPGRIHQMQATMQNGPETWDAGDVLVLCGAPWSQRCTAILQDAAQAGVPIIGLGAPVPAQAERWSAFVPITSAVPEVVYLGVAQALQDLVRGAINVHNARKTLG